MAGFLNKSLNACSRSTTKTVQIDTQSVPSSQNIFIVNFKQIYPSCSLKVILWTLMFLSLRYFIGGVWNTPTNIYDTEFLAKTNSAMNSQIYAVGELKSVTTLTENKDFANYYYYYYYYYYYCSYYYYYYCYYYYYYQATAKCRTIKKTFKICNHSKIWRRKLVKYIIDICHKIVRDIFIKLEIFLVVQVYLQWSLYYSRNNASFISNRLFNFEKLS